MSRYISTNAQTLYNVNWHGLCFIANTMLIQNIKLDAFVYLCSLKKQFGIEYFQLSQITNRDKVIHAYCMKHNFLVRSLMEHADYYYNINDNTFKYISAIQRELIQYMS